MPLLPIHKASVSFTEWVSHRSTPRELKHLVHQPTDGGQQEYFYEDCHNVFTSLPYL